MYFQFNERAFAGTFRAGDSRRFDIDIKNNRTAIIESAINEAQCGTGIFSPLYTAKVKQRYCTSLKNYSQILILRLISKYIGRRLRAAPKNRDHLVKSVIESLSDSSPMYIIRRDIKSFYETIDASSIKNRLLNDLPLPRSVKNHLARFFLSFPTGPSTGLPRGIALSAIFAELHMEQFDKAVQKIPGVYRYFRYSDDILIFSTINPNDFETKLDDLLPSGMSFNTKKSKIVSATCKNKNLAKEVNFEFLGYQYNFSDQIESKNGRDIYVCIAERKITRIKTKIFCAIKSHKKTGDFSLLLDRLKFLSGNFSVLRQGVSAIKTSRSVKSGIYYNYKLCGRYSNGKCDSHAGTELKALDGFYQSLIRSLSASGMGITIAQHGILSKISFYQGYSNKFTHKFDGGRVHQIKEVWKNA